MSSVTLIDKGWNRTVGQLAEFASWDVYMGWIEGKKEKRRNRSKGGKQTITNAGLAAVHEYGATIGNAVIPEGRLGFRAWADRNKERIGKEFSAAFISTIGEGNAKKQLERLGLWAVSDWRKYLLEVQPGPELSIAREKQIVRKHGTKGFFRSKKLVDTSQLINGATHQLRRKSSIDGSTI